MVKQKTVVENENQAESEIGKRQRGGVKGAVPFPRTSLKDAIEIPKGIWKEHGGDPFDPILLAKSLGTTLRSSKFVTLLTSSERYGLTVGGAFAKAISLTELGKAIVAPTDEAELGKHDRAALTTPKIFAQFYNKYDRKNLPRAEFVKSLLEREFDVPRSDVDACYNLLKQNIDDYKLSINSGDSTLLYLDNLGKMQNQVQVPETVAASIIEPSASVTALPQEQAPSTQEAVVKVPRVFISHSKNKKILDNIKQMLAFGKFDYRVAEEKETLSMPLSDKVFGLMQECNCAIINVSADQEKKQGDVYGMNENVLIEIGAAFLHYNKRVLLVIDERFKEKLPSILQGITAIFYEGHELSLSDGMKLMQALGEFRNRL
jgi:predicted nucleotide-binding protein